MNPALQLHIAKIRCTALSRADRSNAYLDPKFVPVLCPNACVHPPQTSSLGREPNEDEAFYTWWEGAAKALVVSLDTTFIQASDDGIMSRSSALCICSIKTPRCLERTWTLSLFFPQQVYSLGFEEVLHKAASLTTPSQQLPNST